MVVVVMFECECVLQGESDLCEKLLGEGGSNNGDVCVLGRDSV